MNNVNLNNQKSIDKSPPITSNRSSMSSGYAQHGIFIKSCSMEDFMQPNYFDNDDNNSSSEGGSKNSQISNSNVKRLP